MDAADVLYRTAKGVDKCRAAAWNIIIFRHLAYALKRFPVEDDLRSVIEHHTGDKAVASKSSLLPDHGVEASDRVLLEPVHAAALVQYEYHFSKILSHVRVLPYV